MGKSKGGGIRMKQMGPTKEQKAMMKQMQQMKEGGMNPMEDFMKDVPEINLPPPKDKNMKIIWPMHETFTMDFSSFFIVYPSYMDSAKTVKQGRRISKEKSIDTPTLNDISEALQSLNLRHVIEPNKGYSRDPTCSWDNPGRIKIEPSSAYTKRTLLIQLSSIIIELPNRIKRLEVIAAVAKRKEEMRLKAEQEKQLALRQQKQQQSSKGGKGSKSQTQSNKKKGKKKR